MPCLNRLTNILSINLLAARNARQDFANPAHDRLIPLAFKELLHVDSSFPALRREATPLNCHKINDVDGRAKPVMTHEADQRLYLHARIVVPAA